MADTTLQIECLQANAVGTPKLYVYDPASLLAIGNVAGYGIGSSVSLLCRFVIPELDAVSGSVYGEVRDDEKVLAYGWAVAMPGEVRHLAPAMVDELADELISHGDANWTGEDVSVSSTDLAAIEGYVNTARDAVIVHGDAEWITATGFATPSNVSDAQVAILAHGDTNWTTATGFTTAADITASQTAIVAAGDSRWITATGFSTPTNIADAQAAVIAHGDTTWSTASDFATAADVTAAQTAIVAAGDARWITATGFATPVNVTDAQAAIISHGDASWPTATGFATAANVNSARDAILTEGGASWTTASGFAVAADVTAAQAAIIAHGDTTWATATEFATPADVTAVQTAIIAHGDAGWATATGFAEPGDVMQIDMTQATPGLSTVGAQLDAAGTGAGGGEVSLSAADLSTIQGYVNTARDAVITQGDAAWITATGFATPGDEIVLSAADMSTIQGYVTAAQTAIITQGDAAWTTASGFAVAADIAAARDAVIAHGDLAWITATGFAAPADVTAARDTVIAHGDATWTTATGFAAPGDAMFLDLAQATTGGSTVGAQLDAVGTGGLTAAEASHLLAIYQLTAASGGTGTLNASAVTGIAGDVRTLLEAAHGTGSWEGGAGAAGGGPVPLTVTVETSGGDPLAGVNIYILDSNGDPTGKWLPTDGEGQCVFGLAPGDYFIAVASLAGYTTPAPIATTLVAATAASEPIVLASQATEPPGAAGLCTIDDYILDGSKTGVAGAIVTATASPDAVLVDPGILSQVRARAVTDANGRFTLQLVRADAMSFGKDYTIEVKSQAKSIFRQIIGPIPNANSATLKEIEAGA